MFQLSENILHTSVYPAEVTYDFLPYKGQQFHLVMSLPVAPVVLFLSGQSYDYLIRILHSSPSLSLSHSISHTHTNCADHIDKEKLVLASIAKNQQMCFN